MSQDFQEAEHEADLGTLCSPFFWHVRNFWVTGKIRNVYIYGWSSNLCFLLPTTLSTRLQPALLLGVNSDLLQPILGHVTAKHELSQLQKDAPPPFSNTHFNEWGWTTYSLKLFIILEKEADTVSHLSFIVATVAFKMKSVKLHRKYFIWI